MKLGTRVGLGLGHIVLDGNPAPPPLKGHNPPPIFGPYLLWPNGWMPLGKKVGLGPSDIVLDGDPLPKKGAESPHNFRPMSIVAKQLHGSRYPLVCR